MSAGILALTNKSDVVAGTGTLFNTELVAGDFILVTVGGVPYTLPVKTINSNTSLTLVSNFTGPTQSGAAWSAVPRVAMNLVTAALVVQSAEALRGLNYDKQNWQAVFSNNSNITVKLPDGSMFTGPSWAKIVDILNTLDVTHLEALAAQIDLDAQQVASDKATVDTKSSLVAADATQVAEDRLDVDAKASQVSSDAASSSANAVTAKNEADRAVAAAGNVDFTFAEVRSLIDALCPVGQKLDWPSETLPDNPTLGVKYLRLNGATFNTKLYPKLAAVFPSGTLPDMRGEIARGFDDGRGVDQGRAILSEQLDAVPNVTGVIGGMSNDGSSAGYTGVPTGPFTVLGAAVKALAANAALGAGTRYTALNFDLSAGGTNASYGRNGATEVRMRNMAWNMIVRAS